MVWRALLGSTFIVFVSSAASFAAGSAEWLQDAGISSTVFNKQIRYDRNIIDIHYSSVFLGCVYSYHQCEHLGHSRGFYNHSVRHDHRTCHHGPSYACYGR